MAAVSGRSPLFDNAIRQVWAAKRNQSFFNLIRPLLKNVSFSVDAVPSGEPPLARTCIPFHTNEWTFLALDIIISVRLCFVSIPGRGVPPRAPTEVRENENK